MTSTAAYDSLKDQRAKLIESVLASLSPQTLADPHLAEIVSQLVDKKLASGTAAGGAASPPADGGLADLVGLGSAAPLHPGATQMSPGVVDYDDTVTSDRLLATADLYYQAVHEGLGVFEVVNKLQELFRAGTLRISAGPGAFGLYRFDKHAVLRYRRQERMQAYRRVLGYGAGGPGANARPNPEFHGLL